MHATISNKVRGVVGGAVARWCVKHVRPPNRRLLLVKLPAQSLSTEVVLPIVYQPLATFRVSAVTRCTDTIQGSCSLQRPEGGYLFSQPLHLQATPMRCSTSASLQMAQCSPVVEETHWCASLMRGRRHRSTTAPATSTMCCAQHGRQTDHGLRPLTRSARFGE